MTSDAVRPREQTLTGCWLDRISITAKIECILNRNKPTNTMKFVWIFLSGFLLLKLCRSEAIITLDNCKCAEGYKPQKFEDGRIECVGINVYNTEPCNTPTPPPCTCTGDVSGILTDASGTWCSAITKDKGLKKWPCENQDEWKNFKKSATP